MKKLIITSFLALNVLFLGACGTEAEKKDSEKANNTVALITDNGVDDRSFNQAAWEGLESWGKERDLKQGVGGYQYFHSANEANFIPNIDQALNADFQTIFGIGYKLTSAISEQAQRNPETNFVIIDDVIEGQENVVSATFKTNEAAYLAGLAAAYTTKTDKVGFIGGIKGVVIESFDVGFKEGVQAGAKALNKEIKILNQYAGAFDAPDKGRSIAQGMYAQGTDIIYAAAGGTGTGLFQEAKSINESGDKKVWVIGVDRDQTDEGIYLQNGKEENFTLTSTLKDVGMTVQDLSTKASDKAFPGGEHLVYGLKENGVSLTKGQLTDDVKKVVDEAREKIISGKIKVAGA